MWNQNFIPMNQFNQMNPMNQFNQMNQINQMNQYNQMNQFNQFNQYNQMNNQNMNNNIFQNNIPLTNSFNQINMNYNNNNSNIYNNYNPNFMNNSMNIPRLNNPLNIPASIKNIEKSCNDIKLYNDNNHIIKKDLNQNEYFLYTFFKLIEIEQEKGRKMELIKKNKNLLNPNKKSKIYINYYNIIKSEIFIDLNLSIEILIKDIISQIFCPEFENGVDECIYKYSNILYFEFQEMNLSNISDKTGNELGIKNGDEIYLKLYPELYDEINTFTKDISIFIFLHTVPIGSFTPKKDGLSKNFLKYFNEKNYHINSNANIDTIPPSGKINLLMKNIVT